MRFVLLAAVLATPAAARPPDTRAYDRANAAAVACDYRQADTYVVSDVRSDEAARLSFDACEPLHRRAAADFLASADVLDEPGLERSVADIRRKLLPTLTQYIVQRRLQITRRPAPRPRSAPRDQAL